MTEFAPGTSTQPKGSTEPELANATLPPATQPNGSSGLNSNQSHQDKENSEAPAANKTPEQAVRKFVMDHLERNQKRVPFFRNIKQAMTQHDYRCYIYNPNDENLPDEIHQAMQGVSAGVLTERKALIVHVNVIQAIQGAKNIAELRSASDQLTGILANEGVHIVQNSSHPSYKGEEGANQIRLALTSEEPTKAQEAFALRLSEEVASGLATLVARLQLRRDGFVPDQSFLALRAVNNIVEKAVSLYFDRLVNNTFEAENVAALSEEDRKTFKAELQNLVETRLDGHVLRMLTEVGVIQPMVK